MRSSHCRRSTAVALEAVRAGAADFALRADPGTPSGAASFHAGRTGCRFAAAIYAELTLDCRLQHRHPTGRSPARCTPWRRSSRGRLECAVGCPPIFRAPRSSRPTRTRPPPATSRRVAPTPGSAPRWRPSVMAWRRGRRRRRRTERPHPVRPGRSPRSAAPTDRRGPHLSGAADQQCAWRAGVGDERVRYSRHRPHPHRIPAHQNRTRYLCLLSGLWVTSTTGRGGRGAQGAASALRRRALPGVMANRRGGRIGCHHSSTRPSSGWHGCAGVRCERPVDPRAPRTVAPATWSDDWTPVRQGPTSPTSVSRRRRRSPAPSPARRACCCTRWPAGRRRRRRRSAPNRESPCGKSSAYTR